MSGDEDDGANFTKFRIEFRPWSFDGLISKEIVAETGDDAKKKFLALLSGSCIPSFFHLTGSKRLNIVEKKVYIEDRHIACFSYPNCDVDPMGCRVKMGDAVEPYGHRD